MSGLILGLIREQPTSEVPIGGGALSGRAHVFVLVVTLLTIVWMVRLVRRHKLRTKYSLLWVLIAVVLATVAVFPGLLEKLSSAAGVYYPPATFLFMAVGFLFVIVVHFSWEFSRADERIRTLAEELALLRAEHEELAQQVKSPPSGSTTPDRALVDQMAPESVESDSTRSVGDDDEPVGSERTTEPGQ